MFRIQTVGPLAMRNGRRSQIDQTYKEKAVTLQLETKPTGDLTDAPGAVSQSWSTEDGTILRNLTAGKLSGLSRMKLADVPERVDHETLSTTWEWMELRGKTPRWPPWFPPLRELVTHAWQARPAPP